MATIEFSTPAMKRLGENTLDGIVVVAVLSWMDIVLGFNVIPDIVTNLVAWPTLIGGAWLTWKFVRGHQWFK